VTGASTGIGRATAVTLADAGYHVFAGVRKESDGAALSALSRGTLTLLHLDVTDSVAVSEAAETVTRVMGPQGLTGLVNNAGIGLTWPMEVIPVELLRHQYDVNVFGQVTVIQAFLPLLRRAAGRIITIGSIGDRLTLPYGAPLTSSKWALASITEALRLELRPWAIRVVLIEPASINTDAVGKVQAEARAGAARARRSAAGPVRGHLPQDDRPGGGPGEEWQQPAGGRGPDIARAQHHHTEDTVPGRT